MASPFGVAGSYWPWETPTGYGFQLGPAFGGQSLEQMYAESGQTPPASVGTLAPNVTPGQLSYDYEGLIAAALPDNTKYLIISQYFPNKLVDWVRKPTEEGGGASWFMGQPFTDLDNAIKTLPQGEQLAVGQDGLPHLYAPTGGAAGSNLLYPNVPQGAQPVIEGSLWKDPATGKFYGIDGREIDPTTAATWQETVFGEGYQEQTAFPTQPAQSGYRWEWDGRGWIQVPGLVPSLPGEEPMTAWQEAQIQLEQSQAAADAQWRQQQLALEQQQMQMQQAEAQRQYEAELIAQGPSAWLKQAAYAGETPQTQPWMLPLMPEQYAGMQAGQPMPGWPGAQLSGGPAGTTYSAYANNPAYIAERDRLAAEAAAVPWMRWEGQSGDVRFGPNPYPYSARTNETFTPTQLGTTELATGMPSLINPSQQYLARMSPTMQGMYTGYQQAQSGQSPQDVDWRLWNMAPPGGSSGMNLQQWR